MKQSAFFFLTLFISTICLGQKMKKDIQVSYNLDSVAVGKIISFLDVDYQRYTISEKFKDNYCNLTIEEYRNGEIVDTKNIRKDIKLYEQVLFIGSNLNDSLFNIEFLSRLISDSLLKVKINIGGLGYNAKLKLVDSLHYSWKPLTDINKANFKITGTSLPLLAFTSAIGEKFTNYPGNFEFCRINNEYIPYKDWYKKLGIEHFLFLLFVLKKHNYS